MSKYLIHRSKRLAFIQSTISKCRSQLRLVEGRQVQPQKEQCVAKKVDKEKDEDSENVSTFLVGQRLLYWRKSSVGVTEGEIKKDENEEEERGDVFFDCKDEIMDDQSDSGESLHAENDENGEVSVCFVNEDGCSLYESEEDDIMSEIEVVEVVEEKGSRCQVKPIVFWLCFIAIGSYMIQIPNMWEDKDFAWWTVNGEGLY